MKSPLMIRVRVSVSEHTRLQELARQNNKTISDLIREAINEIAADCQDDPEIMRLRKNAA